jgi:hypothetical protein
VANWPFWGTRQSAQEQYRRVIRQDSPFIVSFSAILLQMFMARHSLNNPV